MFWNFSALYKKTQSISKNSQSGFGLIELMVSISILVIIMGVILTRQSSFDSAVLLKGQAYEIALRLREVQLSAVSAKYEGADFRSELGVYFDTVAFEDRYSVFKDSDSGLDNNNFFDSGEEFDIQGILDPRFEITDIKLGGTSVNDVSVIFIRPNFDAMFFTAPGVQSTETNLQIEVGIVGGGSTSTVEVTSTGQIGVI